MISDHKIVAYFRNGQREKAFGQLYRLLPRIEKFIVAQGGNKQDAQDIFQESLIIVYRNLEKNNFTLTASLSTYLHAVSKYIWKDMKRKSLKMEMKEVVNEDTTIFNSIVEEQKYKRAERAFEKLGERCQKILKLFYLKKLPFKKIAEQLGFASEKVAKNQKYKCLQKAKSFYQNPVNS